MNQPSSSQSASGASLIPTLIIGAMFFIAGFVTWLNGPLITFVKLAFDLDDVNAFLVPQVFFLSYFFLALPASWILRRTGMKRGMALGLFVMAVGAALFGQFAALRIYPGVLTGLFVIGAGLSLLQTASNPYISILGPIKSAARRVAFMGICNKAAGMMAPFVIGVLVLHGLGDLTKHVASADPASRAQILQGFAAKIHAPYIGMAVLLALLGVGIIYSPLPEIDPGHSNRSLRQGSGLASFPHLWLGALCLFLYVGVEVMAGDAIGTYGAGFQLPPDQTVFFSFFTLTAMLLGYLLGLLLIPRVISQHRYLMISACLGVLLSVGAYLTRGYISVGFVAALGLANAMMWPAIFPLAIRGLGPLTERGSAIMIMGICGGGLIPSLFAHLKVHHNFQLVFTGLVVPCYLYILFYGLHGYRVGFASTPEPDQH